MSENKHLIPQTYKITKSDRARLNGHRSCIVWFTGLSGSGKSTLANSTEQRLYELGVHTYTLDGDNIRSGLNRNVDFSPQGRTENIRRISEVAKLFADAGLVVLTAFISPFIADRELARSMVADGEFIEVFVDCPLEICEQRDVKGLYKLARAGEISDFTGVSSPFEPPVRPELIINTSLQTVAEATDKIVAAVLNKIEVIK